MEQTITELIDMVDTYLYQSAVDILNYRRYVVRAQKIYQLRGPPTNENASPEVAKVCDAMNNSFNNYDIIHVTGTNGKGSVCLKLSNALLTFYDTRKKIGLLTSPHINCMRERIQINGEMISAYDFYFGITQLLNIENKLTNEGIIHTPLISAELQTLLAFWYFNFKQIDIAILECNLGGKYDATNIITEPLLSIITTVSFDHEVALGYDLESITNHKCGIIKYLKPCIIGPNVNIDWTKKYIKENNLNAPLFQLNQKQCDQCKNYDDINIEIAKFALDILKKYYDNFKYMFDDKLYQNKMEKALKIRQMEDWNCINLNILN